MSTWTTHRARVASLSRTRAADDPDLAAARRDLAVARLEHHLRRAVDQTQLTVDEQQHLAAILTDPTGGRRAS